jgi:hypothetical protein
MNTIMPHMDTNIQNMCVQHMLLDSVGSSVSKSMGFQQEQTAPCYPKKGAVDAIQLQYAFCIGL